MKTRYRVQPRWFRDPLVVLQVADTASYTDPITCETRSWPIWRDATAEDVMNPENPA